MHINIPQAEQEQIARMATAAGYSDVEHYITEHVLALAYQQPDELPSLTSDELKASLQMCDQSMAEFDAGRGLTSEQARSQTLDYLRQRPQ